MNTSKAIKHGTLMTTLLIALAAASHAQTGPRGYTEQSEARMMRQPHGNGQLRICVAYRIRNMTADAVRITPARVRWVSLSPTGEIERELAGAVIRANWVASGAAAWVDKPWCRIVPVQSPPLSFAIEDPALWTSPMRLTEAPLLPPSADLVREFRRDLESKR